MPIGMLEFNPHDRRVLDTAYCDTIIRNQTAAASNAIEQARIDPKALQSLHNVVLNDMLPVQRLARNKAVNRAKPSHDNIIKASAALAMIGAQYERLAQAERGIAGPGNTQINIQIVAPAPVSREEVEAEFKLVE